MIGEIGILSVGAGDTKLSFNSKNPAEAIRAKRIVTDMLRRGYALLVEIDDGKGGKHYARATAFDENTCEYIIADFDPTASEEHPGDVQAKPAAAPRAEGRPAGKKKGRPVTRIPAARAKAVAVGRTAGG